MNQEEIDFLEECLKLINKGEKPENLVNKFDKNLIKKSGLLSVKT